MVLPLWKKPRARIEDFHAFSPHKALLYHLVYHYSIFTHINHLILLNVYLAAVLSLAGTIGGATIGAILGVYAIFLGEHLSIPYLGVLYGLYRISIFIDWNIWYKLVVIPVSLILQLLGHWIFEDYQAPPSLIHGFIAAPILEWLALVKRFQYNHHLWREVEANRP